MGDNTGKSREEVQQQVEEKKEVIRETYKNCDTPEKAVESLSKWRDSPDRPANKPTP